MRFVPRGVHNVLPEFVSETFKVFLIIATSFRSRRTNAYCFADAPYEQKKPY